MYSSRLSFTLIELLIVIAIVAVLAAVVVVTLSPAELLRQSRDSSRLSDISTLNTALSLAATEIFSASVWGNTTTTYLSLIDSAATTTAGTDCASLGLSAPGGIANHCPASSTATRMDGSGWLPLDFRLLSSGSPMGALPQDPTPSSYYYTYQESGPGRFKITTILESQKFLSQARSDGGLDPAVFERGSDLSLPSAGRGLMGYWTFDEGGGATSSDLSGGASTATLYNNLTWTGGKLGGALVSSGSTAQAIPANPMNFRYTGGNFTLSVWVNADPTDDGGQIVSKPWNGSGWYNYSLISTGGASSAITFSIVGATGYSTPGFTISTGSWHHIAATLDPNRNIALYIDGVLRYSATHMVVSWVPGGGDFSIELSTFCIYPYTNNNCAGSTAQDFKGSIDELRIYARTLSASEIQALYNSTP